MNAKEFLINNFQVNFHTRKPVLTIPNVGRDNLAQWLHALGCETGVEVGVAKGHYSEVLCKANPQMKIYGVDAWQPYEGYDDYISVEGLNSMYEASVARMAPYQNYTIIRAWSSDAVKQFEDNSLDFVYLDANHADPFISEDIELWNQKIRPGRILAGHDYVKWIGVDYGVMEAVHSYAGNNNIKPYFVLGSKNSKPGDERDKYRSWMWIKP